jgi:hypothetical protein
MRNGPVLNHRFPCAFVCGDDIDFQMFVHECRMIVRVTCFEYLPRYTIQKQLAKLICIKAQMRGYPHDVSPLAHHVKVFSKDRSVTVIFQIGEAIDVVIGVKRMAGPLNIL